MRLASPANVRAEAVTVAGAIPLPLFTPAERGEPSVDDLAGWFVADTEVREVRLLAVEPERFALAEAAVRPVPAWHTLAPDWRVGPLRFPPRPHPAARTGPVTVAGWAVAVADAEAVAFAGATLRCGVCAVVALRFDPPLAPGRHRIEGEFRDPAGRPAHVEPRLLRPDAASPLDALAVLRRTDGARYAAEFTLAAPAATLLLRPREGEGTVVVPRLAVGRARLRDRLRTLVPRRPAPPGPPLPRERERGTLAEGPLASIVVATKDAPGHLARFLRTLADTRYAPRELVLVDNGSTDAAALALLAEAAARPDVTLVRDDRRFNFAALCNRGAAAARGDVLVFANNDIAFVDPDWLGALVAAALDPAVGVAGARLLYPDGRVQHAGLVLAGESRIRHTERFLAGRAPGHDGRARRTTAVSAVTGALMAIRADLFRAVDGFDPALGVLLNDADLSLRAGRGRTNLLVPAASATHHESATIGPRAGGLFERGGPLWRWERAEEARRFRARWGDLADGDPCYPTGLDPLAADFRRRAFDE